MLRAQEGDGEAFRTLVESYGRRLALLYCIRRVSRCDPEKAFDVLQEDLAAVLTEICESFLITTSTLAYTIIRSPMTRRFRHCGVVTEKSHLRNCPSTKCPILMRPIRHSTLLTWFMPLLQGNVTGPSSRAPLHFLEEMSVKKEIAEVLATNTGTVKSRLHYAKAALRRWMEEREHE